jgi:glycine/D-amino acid oxidase-like deaminating enzyme
MVQGTQAQVAIIGGGIGGLTAAATLLRAGFEVQIYEQAKSLGEVGAGINIGPNCRDSNLSENARDTRTSTVCCVSTSRQEPTSRASHRVI